MTYNTDTGKVDDDRIELAASRIARSRYTVVSTGAGISRESGIPTFRDLDGLWGKYRPEELATREGFIANPGLVWRWYRERLATARAHEPNPGHYALAELERLLPRFLIVTQNIDNLHLRAGNREIVELHGNISRYKCLEYGHPAEPSDEWGDEPPLCHCGSLIRPDVVWFGESLHEIELECAFKETQKCDLMLVVGTSGLVQPAANLPVLAKQVGAVVIEINPSRSELTPLADIFLMGPSGEILPRLLDKVKEFLDEDSTG
jgi:NAD-dependent deacetylase